MEIQETVKLSREEMFAALHDRDGDICAFPGCEEKLDFSILNDADPKFVTVDHHMPKSWCFANGWTYEQIWDLDNLRLMHKKCNAKKANRIPNEDGSLPERNRKEFRYRRQKRANRPEVCTSCNSGRSLEENQFCNACGSGPMPLRTPKWRQMLPKDCDHDLFFCSSCYLGFVPRRSALDSLITGGEGYE